MCGEERGRGIITYLLASFKVLLNAEHVATHRCAQAHHLATKTDKRRHPLIAAIFGRGPLERGDRGRLEPREWMEIAPN